MTDWVLYDRVATGTTALTHTFFADDEATSGETNTNLPTKNMVDYDFVIREIHLLPDLDITRADSLKLQKGIIKVRISDTDVLKCPSLMCISEHRFSTEGTVATGEVISIGKTMGGFRLTTPVRIPANTKFNVYLVMESAFGADTDLVCALLGDR